MQCICSVLYLKWSALEPCWSSLTDNDLIGEPDVAMPDITAKENENKLFSFGGNKATRPSWNKWITHEKVSLPFLKIYKLRLLLTDVQSKLGVKLGIENESYTQVFYTVSTWCDHSP